jgi:hypothetical protein
MTSQIFGQNGKKIPLSGKTEEGDFEFFRFSSPLSAKAQGKTVLLLFKWQEEYNRW